MYLDELQIPSEITIKTKFCSTTHVEVMNMFFIIASSSENFGRNSEPLRFLCKSKEHEFSFWRAVQKKSKVVMNK